MVEGKITRADSVKLSRLIAEYADARAYADYASINLMGETRFRAERSFDIIRRELTEFILAITEE